MAADKKSNNPVDKQFKNSRIKNLKGKGFKPGQSGNLKGRPKKGFAIADILNATGDIKAPTDLTKIIRDALDLKNKPLTMREAMLMMAYLQAIKGDRDARNFISDRTEGKALERISFNNSEAPFEVWRSKVKDAK